MKWTSSKWARAIGHTVYVIEAVGINAVKIGRTGDLENRLGGMRTDCPAPLVVLVATCDNARRERALHTLFADEHIHGEWFTASTRLRAFVEWMKTASTAEIGARLRLARPLVGIEAST